MTNLVTTTRDELKRIINEALDERESFMKSGAENNVAKTEEQVTSLRQIAELFNCSLPTAQKIKNRLPKHRYKQVGRKFVIPKSLLLRPDVNDTIP